MQILHVRDCVYDPARTQNVRVLCRERARDDSGLVLFALEVWIRKSKEDGAKLRLAEDIGKKFHSVGTEYSDILIGACLGWRICDFRLGTCFLGGYRLCVI